MTTQSKVIITCLSNILPDFISIPSVIVSLVCWLAWKNDEDPNVADYARRRLNTGISWTIYALVSILLCSVVIGFFILPVLAICWIVFVIKDVVRALNGDTSYVFPWTIEFIKRPALPCGE